MDGMLLSKFNSGNYFLKKEIKTGNLWFHKWGSKWGSVVKHSILKRRNKEPWFLSAIFIWGGAYTFNGIIFEPE